MVTATQIFTMVVHPAEEGGYWAELLELPGCVTQGETLEELKQNMREALEAVLQQDAEELPITVVHDEGPPLRPSQTPENWTSTGTAG